MCGPTDIVGKIARAIGPVFLVLGLFGGLLTAAPVSIDEASLAATQTGDCNGNSTRDLSEAPWANRDDDDDGICNGADPCPDEAGATCAMQAITVPADPQDASVPHLTYSGATHTLKGIARYGGNQYMWDFGDGTTPMAWTNISNPYVLAVNHVYTGTVDTTYVATLSVRNSAAPATVATDTYAVQIGPAPTGSPAGTPATDAETDVRVAMAVDQGRWYLHTTMTRGTYADGAPGYRQPYGSWNGFAMNYNSNCIALDALLTGGSGPDGDYANDPYVETVRRSLNFTLQQSVQVAVANQVHGGVIHSPDGNGNGVGVRLGNDSQPRVSAACLTALAHTGSPDRVATTGSNANVYGRTYLQLAQDAVDWFAWAQNDSGAFRGAWGYTANDNYYPEVNGRGMEPTALANAAAFGATVPPWTKTEHQFWLSYHRHATKDNRNGGFGFNSPNDQYINVAHTAGALIGHLWVGSSLTDQVGMSGLGYLWRYWTLNNYDGGGAWNIHLGNSSVMFLTSQLMRAGGLSTFSNWDYNNNVPASTGTPRKWFYDYTPGAGGASQPGLARNLVMRQQASGMWSDIIGNDATSGAPATALAVMTLDGVSPVGTVPVTAKASHTVNGVNGWNTTATVNEVVKTTGAVSAVTCSDGTTTFTGSGSGSTWTVPVTGEGTHELTCTATGPTSSATSALDVVKIDSVAPAVTGTPSSAAGASGWHTAPVTVTWSATDDTAGVATVTSPVDVGEGADQTAAGSATDLAGNVGYGTYGPLDIDTTAPSTILTLVSGAVTNDEVAVLELTSSDNLSGVASTSITVDGETTDHEGSTSGTFEVTGEGRHEVTISSVDVAGNSEAPHTIELLIDLEAPSIETSASATPRNGWFDAPVTMTVTCEDGTLADGTPGSGVVGCGIAPSGDAEATYEEGRHSVVAAAADAAGNTAEQPLDVLVDEEAPVIVATPDRAANDAGWYDAPVSVSFACADGTLADGSDGSGVEACNDVAHLGDGTQVTVYGDTIDVAGNTATSDGVHVKIDATDPTISWTVNGSSSLALWYADDVTVSFTCADAGGSGVVSCPDPVTVTGEGTNLSTTVEVSDEAGNVVGLTVDGINIDRSAPTATATLSSVANDAGWHDEVVVVQWTCADPELADGSAGSGVVACPDDVIVADGAAQVFDATVDDVAGNTSDPSSVTVSQDTAQPLVDVTRTTTPSSVTVHFACSDALSGVVEGTCPADYTVTVSSPAQTYTVADVAGNETTVTVGAIVVDTTAPTITFAGNLGTYDVADTVTITCTATDDGSGVRETTCPDVVTGAAYDFGLGTVSRTATATDNVGNTATATASFTVTVDATSLSTVQEQFIEGSTKYQALKPNQRASGDAVVVSLGQLAENVARASTSARTGRVNAYKAQITNNVRQGWLTQAQGDLLTSLVTSL